MTARKTAGRAGLLPAWLKKRLGADEGGRRVEELLADLGLETVCSGARCPNLAECFGGGTAAFLILGDRCTRACGFCAMRSSSGGGICGLPSPPADEPDRLAEACGRLGLRHVVITSVTRDDLPDGGAGHFARCVRAVRRRVPESVVEVLTPDFQGDAAAVDTVIEAGVDIFNHNVETVPRLYPRVRPQADYRRSLGLLAGARRRWPGRRGGRLCTKSGLMVGLGETDDEVRQVLRDLRAAACEIVTIGQYLAPSAEHLPVARFVAPGRFETLRSEAEAMGFAAVAAGPFVRSSYRARSLFGSRVEPPAAQKETPCPPPPLSP